LHVIERHCISAGAGHAGHGHGYARICEDVRGHAAGGAGGTAQQVGLAANKRILHKWDRRGGDTICMCSRNGFDLVIPPTGREATHIFSFCKYLWGVFHGKFTGGVNQFMASN